MTAAAIAIDQDAGTVIYPTHTCFDDAVEYIERRCRNQPEQARGYGLMLVHAICTNPDTGERFAHAWVEEDARYVVFAGIINGERGFFRAYRNEYVRQLNPNPITRYNCRQLLVEYRKSGNCGPWKPEYKALVKQP
jgi:hypothetical protein